MEMEVAATPNVPAPVSDANEPDDSSTTAKNGEDDSKQTFARRYRPKRDDPAKRWDGIQTIFMRHVKNRFSKPSSFEVWGFKKHISNPCTSMFRRFTMVYCIHSILVFCMLFPYRSCFGTIASQSRRKRIMRSRTTPISLRAVCLHSLSWMLSKVPEKKN